MTEPSAVLDAELLTRGRGRPTAKMQERLFRHILDTALHVFKEQGFGGATVQQICGSARISLATFYRHFRGKEDVFRASIRQFNDAQSRSLSGIGRMNLRDGLLQAARDHLDHAEKVDTHEIIRLIYAETRRFPDLSREFLNGTVEWLTILRDFIRQHRPDIRATDAYDLAIMFMDMIGGRVEHEHLFCVTPSPPGVNRRRAEIAVGFFLAGLADFRPEAVSS